MGVGSVVEDHLLRIVSGVLFVFPEVKIDHWVQCLEIADLQLDSCFVVVFW